MDQNAIKQALDQWMMDFVEVNHPTLNNWPPCPYARSARLSGMITVVFASVDQFKDTIYQSLDTLDHKDVVVICFDHDTIDPEVLQEFVSGMNQTLMPKNYVILEDHPHAPEYVNGVRMNFGHCGLLILQKLNKLNSAADKLRSQGYYDAWDSKALDQVVSWRYK